MMTEVEIIKHARICAKAMDLEEVSSQLTALPCVLMKRKGYEEIIEYNPLTNDELLIALIKNHNLWIDGSRDSVRWSVGGGSELNTHCNTLNEAIIKHVVKMYLRRHPGEL